MRIRRNRYSNYTDEEIEILEEKLRLYNILYGMEESLRLLQTAEKYAEKEHPGSAFLRKQIDKQRDTLNNLKYPDDLKAKVIRDIHRGDRREIIYIRILYWDIKVWKNLSFEIEKNLDVAKNGLKGKKFIVVYTFFNLI